MNLLKVSDLTKKDIQEVFTLAESIKKGNRHLLTERMTLALLFEKTSTRTRVSFESAIAKLGGEGIYIDTRTSQLAVGETLGDTAKVLGRYVDFIAARLYKQSDLEEIARHSGVPTINALTDLEHPCQALSDMFTIKEVMRKTEGVRIAFVGDVAANTANSLMIASAMLGSDIVLIGPEGYAPNEDYVRQARKYNSVEIFNNPKEGLKGVDILYTDTFVSMGQEAEAAKRKKLFAAYQVNSKLVAYAKPGAKVMHCLPAHREIEITSEVLDGKKSIVWQQAENKMWVEAAIIVYLNRKS